MLYAEDLARRLHAMEQALEPMDAVAYRLYARRLRRALAGLSQLQLRRVLIAHVALQEARANLFFAEHGHFEGHPEVAKQSQQCLRRWKAIPG